MGLAKSGVKEGRVIARWPLEPFCGVKYIRLTMSHLQDGLGTKEDSVLILANLKAYGGDTPKGKGWGYAEGAKPLIYRPVLISKENALKRS